MSRENEIDDILECIGNAWRKMPEMRLGQLVANVMHAKPRLGRGECDPYYIKDWDLVEGIEQLALVPSVLGKVAI